MLSLDIQWKFIWKILNLYQFLYLFDFMMICFQAFRKSWKTWNSDLKDSTTYSKTSFFRKFRKIKFKNLAKTSVLFFE